MQQHDGKHPHYFRTAVLRLLQQELLAATGQVYLYQRDNVGNQYQINILIYTGDLTLEYTRLNEIISTEYILPAME